MGSRFHFPLIVSIVLAFLLSFYGLVGVATHLDEYLLPGNELNVGILAQLPGVDKGDVPEAASIQQRINVLLLGLDRRPDEPPGSPIRTDTIAILSIDPYSNTAGVLSIPRDTWVEIPDGRGGFLEERINAAYTLAQTGVVFHREGPPGLVKETIVHNFGIPIDHYVVLDFVDFIRVIDTLGGIEIDVPEYVYDPAYQECYTCPAMAVTFRPGRQHMDGHLALAYGRIRYGSNDFERIERQQQVMRATFRKAMDLGLLMDPGRLKSLYSQFRSSVDTDVSLPRALGLALKVRQIPEERIKTMSLAPAMRDYITPEGWSVLIWEQEDVQRIVRRFFLDGRLEQEAPTIEVRNGTDVPGLATRVATFLVDQGLPEEWVSIDPEPAPGHRYTLIYTVREKEYSARKLAEWLGLSPGQVVVDPALIPPGEADIIVVAATDVRLLARNP
jgi:LCP family protein required for cell wall assembly